MLGIPGGSHYLCGSSKACRPICEPRGELSFGERHLYSKLPRLGNADSTIVIALCSDQAHVGGPQKNRDKASNVGD